MNKLQYKTFVAKILITAIMNWGYQKSQKKLISQKNFIQNLEKKHSDFTEKKKQFEHLGKFKKKKLKRTQQYGFN